MAGWQRLLDPAPKTAPKAKAKPEAKAQPKTQAKAAAKAQGKAAAKAQPKAKVQAKPKAKVQAKAQAKVQAKAKAKVQTKAKAKAQGKTAAKAAPKAAGKALAKGAKPKAVAKKVSAKDKALKAAKAIKGGRTQKRKYRIRTSVHFYRPKTLRLSRNPRYVRNSVPHTNKMDRHRILKCPLTTESAMKKIEEHNTLVFIVDLKANKHHIKDAVKKMYDIKAQKINTLIRPDGYKKAFVRLTEDHDALDVANKIGII